VNTGCSARTVRNFWCTFHHVTVSYPETVHRTVMNKAGRVVTGRKNIVKEIKNEIGARLEHTPWKSFRKLAQETRGFKIINTNCHKTHKTEVT
jgi:hypothetical protein